MTANFFNLLNYIIMIKIPEIKMTVSFDKKVKRSELVYLSDSEMTAKVLRDIFNKDTFDWTEEVVMLCMNRANAVVGFYKISTGGMTSSIIDPRVVFSVALNCGSSSIILAHNHPSGNCVPSDQDKKITKDLKKSGELLNIRVLDHIILTTDKYYSLNEQGDI